ncbi:hypothetical protein PENSPDRAFT_758803 [Peniophora sp. CONT]|nr:hypothetical protein PENSPDRAFT_758803 [Peniophora sp. CONT]
MELSDEPVDYFDPEERLKIEADFACTCALCKVALAAGEGYFIPLMADYSMFNKAVYGIFHKMFKPFEAPNGLYACHPCGRKWLEPREDGFPWAVLVICIPLMIYVCNVIYFAEDEATRGQTLDEILEDLKERPDLTDERRNAAPFLHCYQLLPVLAPEEFIPPPPILDVHPTPSTPVIYKRGSTTTHYRILEHNGGSVPSDTPSVHVPLYGQYEGGEIMLWRIPMRSHGLMVGYAQRLFFEDVYSSKVFDVFSRFLKMMLHNRRLPTGYRMPGAPSVYDVFSPPLTSSEASAKTFSQPMERDASSGSSSGSGSNSTSSTVEGEPSGITWGALPSLVSALKRWL